MSDLTTVTVDVNGTHYERAVEPRLLLSDFLRHELGLTGTHVGCEHGVCGACTVLFDGQPVRSCLMFAVQANGHEVMTVEGLGTPEDLHPIQEAFREAHGATVWLLHARHSDDAGALSGGESRSHRAGDPRGHRREPLPLHRLPAHRGRGQTGSGKDEGMIRDMRCVMYSNYPSSSLVRPVPHESRIAVHSIGVEP